MKKYAVVISLFLNLFLATGINSQQKADSTELIMAFVTFGPVPQEIQMVQDEVNKLIARKINATVKLLPINIGAWGQQSNLMLASGEKVDLMIDGIVPFFSFSTRVAKNQLLPLDDLLKKYGKGIIKSMDKSFLYTGRVNGKLYIIPTVRDFAGDQQIIMRKDIVDELKIDVSKIKDIDDIERVLKLVKEKKPDIIPLVPFTVGPSIVDAFQDYDRIGSFMGVLPDFGKELTVKNLFELPEYVANVKRVRSWYLAGLILKDAPTNKDDFSVFFKAKRAFAAMSQGKPGYDIQESIVTGQPVVTVSYIPPFTTTDNVLSFGWTIPRNSTNPEKAMQLLNLLYSDPQIYNMLVYGFEGKHYVKLPNGQVDYPKGLTPMTVGYSFSGISWMLGNQFQAYVMKDNPPDYWKQMQAFNNRAKKSMALGYIFDITPVKNEVAACQNVLNAYRQGLECGVLDPDKTLPEFNKKLRAAGLDKVIAEKQRQLDEWARVNGIK